MKKPVLTYVYDPLCGWCFGFHPVMEKLAARFEGELTLNVVPGGLATGENAQPISKGYPDLIAEHRRIESVTGVPFGKNFYLLAEEGSYCFDSETPSRAQVTINEMAPELAFPFAVALQKAFFLDGKNLNQWRTFAGLANRFSIDSVRAKQLFKSDRIRQKTQNSFRWSAGHGAGVFPTLLLTIGDETGIISKGYRPFDTIESHLHHLINNFKKIHS